MEILVLYIEEYPIGYVCNFLFIIYLHYGFYGK